jgi:hypothetical protein
VRVGPLTEQVTTDETKDKETSNNSPEKYGPIRSYLRAAFKVPAFDARDLSYPHIQRSEWAPHYLCWMANTRLIGRRRGSRMRRPGLRGSSLGRDCVPEKSAHGSGYLTDVRFQREWPVS